MVNLNARSNLTPDSTPWGKAIEKRLSDLERENALLRNEVSNSGKNISTLSNTVFGSTIQAAYQGEFQYLALPPNSAEGLYELDPVISGTTRTGRLLVTGSVPLRIFNIFPIDSANMTRTLSWYISNTASGSGTQYGQLPLIPRNTLIYEEIGVSLPFAFTISNLELDFSFKLTLRLLTPQVMERSDIIIPAGWSVITQQV